MCICVYVYMCICVYVYMCICNAFIIHNAFLYYIKSHLTIIGSFGILIRLPLFINTINECEIKQIIILHNTMASFASDISGYDVYDIATCEGFKLSLKRRRQLSSYDDISLSSEPAQKRQCLSMMSAVDISASFQPELASTWNERRIAQQIIVDPPEQVVVPPVRLEGPASQLEGHLDAQGLQVSHPNITQPEWPERQPSLNETTLSDSVNVVEVEPRCNLTSLGNPGEPYFKLLREGTTNRKNAIFELPAGYMFTDEGNRGVKNKTRRSWKCCKSKDGCKARIHTLYVYDDPTVLDDKDLELVVYVQKGFHTCEPNPAYYYQKKVSLMSKKLGKKEPHKSGSSIVTYCMSADCKEVGLPTQMSRDTFATDINLARVVNDSRRIEKGVLPNKDNLTDFPINMDYMHAQGFVRFDTVTENKQKGGDIVKQRSIFCATDQELEWLRKSKRIKIDGTFKIVKGPFYQLVSIHSLINAGHRSESVPVGYIIMSGKSQADYTGVFKELKAFMEADGSTWKLKRAMVDYEIALRNALKEVFPAIKLQGCWFHYCQAIYRRVKKLNLENIYIHQAHGGKYIKRIMALALMRDDMIPPLFEYMKKCLEEDKADMSPTVRTAFDKLFEYVEKQWINNSKIPTSEWSVYLTNVRTNNEVENWNGKIWRIACQHPLHLYDLMRVLKNQSEITVEKMRMRYSDTKKAKQKKIDKAIKCAMQKAKSETSLPVTILIDLAKITVKDVLVCNVNSYEYTVDDFDE